MKTLDTGVLGSVLGGDVPQLHTLSPRSCPAGLFIWLLLSCNLYKISETAINRTALTVSSEGLG